MRLAGLFGHTSCSHPPRPYMGLLILYVLLALGFSFLCSIMEAVLLSVTPSYVAALEQEGAATGERLRTLKDDIDRPLAAILSLNTIAHTVGAAGAGAQAAVVFNNQYVGATSAVLTLLILVVSEIIPKSLGASYWRRLAPVVARLLYFVELLMLPLVWLSQHITRLLSKGDREASVSREEFTALAELGEEEGIFEEEESRILRNLFRFSSLRVRDVMTPRTVVQAHPEHQTVGEIIENHDEFRFSRIPVYTETRDDITGYVLKDEILLKAAQEEDTVTLHDLRREMLGVQEALPLPKLFERLLDHGEHIALAVDEYGGTAGIVTMEDVVETLLGLEIVDEVDSTEDMQALARKQWLRRARRLGLVPEAMEDAPDEVRDAVARLGITGSDIPPQEPLGKESLAEEPIAEEPASPQASPSQEPPSQEPPREGRR